MLTHQHRDKKLSVIEIGIHNETEKDTTVEIFGYNYNFMRKRQEGITLVNLSDYYGDDDGSLTMLVDACGREVSVAKYFKNYDKYHAY